MPDVWLPTHLRRLAGGRTVIKVEGRIVREVVDNLERMFPGIKEHLVDGEDLMPGLSVIVDGEHTPMGLLEFVREDSEIHFLPAMGGGSPRWSRAGERRAA